MLKDGRINADALRDLRCQLISHDAAGHALNVWQQIVKRFHFAVWRARGKLLLCAVDPSMGGVLIRGDKGTAGPQRRT